MPARPGNVGQRRPLKAYGSHMILAPHRPSLPCPSCGLSTGTKHECVRDAASGFLVSQRTEFTDGIGGPVDVVFVQLNKRYAMEPTDSRMGSG